MVWTSLQVKYTLLQRLCLYFIKLGPIPQHIGFIMDGNRRFAASNCLQTAEGHSRGFSKLSETIQWCKDLGVKEITVYAFSVENFNRDPEEVSFLFTLATEKLNELLSKLEDLCSSGLRIRLIGNLSMLPLRIQRLGCELMLKTRHNTAVTLNVCMAYGSRDELTESVEHLRVAVRDGLIHPSDIDPDLLSACLYTRSSLPLDLLIRTSGEVRLSDFLVWQSAYFGSVHKFVENYWPVFSFWNFLAAVFHYQVSVTYLSKFSLFVVDPTPQQRVASSSATNKKRSSRIQSFLAHLDQSYWEDVEKRTILTLNSLNSDPRCAQRSAGDSPLP
ncbi:unnamed protein product [Dicrocoelium dendriticum]|nr:unnamed protein product [Dicrocoelium dendriticum]